MFLSKTPTLIKKYYMQLIWELPNNEKKIYLTFDDGPTPSVTDWVLDVLEKMNVKATFFCTGQNVAQNTMLYQRILQENHAVGNHTYSHINGWKTKDEDYLLDVQKCSRWTNSNLFRPPYGRAKKTQLKELAEQYKIVMWDVLSGDYDEGTTPQKCYDNVINNTQSGSIIVFHDSIKAQKNLMNTLPKAITYLKEKGFVFDVIKL